MPQRHRNGLQDKQPNNETLDEGLAERTGLEPATPGVTGRYSNQLNYRSVVGVAGLEPATYGL